MKCVAVKFLKSREEFCRKKDFLKLGKYFFYNFLQIVSKKNLVLVLVLVMVG